MQSRSRRGARHQAGHGDSMGVTLPQDQPNTDRFDPDLQWEPPPDWSGLPLDLLPIVFKKLGVVEVLMGAGLVCRSWREAAKAPEVWRCVDIEHHAVVKTKEQHVLHAMAKLAVDRSGGQIESFAGAGFVTDELLEYIAQRSPCLRRLSLSWCSVSNQGLLKLITKSPLLEELLICRTIS